MYWGGAEPGVHGESIAQACTASMLVPVPTVHRRAAAEAERVRRYDPNGPPPGEGLAEARIFTEVNRMWTMATPGRSGRTSCCVPRGSRGVRSTAARWMGSPP